MKLQRTVWFCVVALVLSLPGVQAQAQGTGPIGPIGSRQLPIPAARGLDIEPSPADSPRPQADTHTLSSIERLGIGSLGVVRSFADPAFRFNQSFDNGIVHNTNTSVSSLGANLLFNHEANRSHLAASYTGAHVLYYPNSIDAATFHTLAVSQEFRWARWVLRLRDDLLISPEAAFGGLYTGGASSEIASQSSTGVADTILTQRANRVNNAGAGEVNYFLSRRSIMTFAGTYNTLDFTDAGAGYIDSHGVTGRVGYDYALAPKDSIGLTYNYSRTTYSGGHPLLRTDRVELSYGRKVTGRMAFQVSAGPERVHSGSQNFLEWTLSTATTYQTRRTRYSLAYTHGISTGSGVFSGTDIHTVVAGVNYLLTQSWAASINSGYAFNRTLTPTAGQADSFGNWYGTASLVRGLGRHLRLVMNYGYQQQNNAAGACPVAACGGAVRARQIAGVTMEWHPWSMMER